MPPGCRCTTRSRTRGWIADPQAVFAEVTLIQDTNMRNPSHSAGGTGELFPNATLPLAGGGSLSLDSFLPRSDLVIVMLGAGPIVPAAALLLDELARARAMIEAEDGQVLLVVATDPGRVPSDWPWPFPPLLDSGARFHARVGAMDAQGQPATSFYVTDRYREIYATARPEHAGWPTTADDVLRWLTFVNIQCPECNPPEW